MRFQYCPHCGKKAELKEIGDEGLIPYCIQCETPLWDMFTTSVIAAVVNECGEIALLRQNYVSTTKYVCVAGIMKLYSSRAIPQERIMTAYSGQSLIYPICWSFSWPYQAMVMKTLETSRSEIVIRANFIMV